ncbi:MAG: 4Fe-4S dicluster domain-containing protein [Deltaproteobacteria bacterium]|nr:MAG: 4Fe-4S dicluster domain-containing protein [Deltaproteobacteria bacterium]
MKKIMLGNEAIARGAYESGVKVAAGYPGTPSTEIMQFLGKHEEVYSEWSVNEKVAMDVAIGASLGGARSLVTMKHAGFNVATDPFYAICFMGINAGLVLACSDDVGAVSSPSEQDTRIYAKLFHIPMLEPSDSQEAKDFTALAYEISEQFDTPVFLRTTNGVSHSMGIVQLGERVDKTKPPFDKSSPKFRPQGGVHPTVMHSNAHDRLKRLEAFANETDINRIEWGDKSVGIISSGTPFQYMKEILPEASFLKLGFTYPLPEALIRKFAGQVKALCVIEELEPFMEEQIRAMGLNVRGQDLRLQAGALSVETLGESLAHITEKFGKKAPERRTSLPGVITRFPTLCAGCLHLAVYYAIRRVQKMMKDREIVIMGDIGCYSLGIAAPHNMLSCAFAMGSSIGSAHGLSYAYEGDKRRAIVAYLGDSTFLHAGMPALLNVLYNRSNITVIIADNGTTAMTGGQEHAGTGVTLKGDRHPPVLIPDVVRSLGVRELYEVDPYDFNQTCDTLTHALEFNGVSVVVARSACRMFPQKIREGHYRVLPELCNGCGMCLSIYCPGAIQSKERTTKRKPKAEIDPIICTGCSFCAQICPANAIVRE